MPRRSIPSPEGDTRNQILHIALHLFALKGFKAVTLKEIAQEAGIKIASLYYYYDGKNVLIEDVLAFCAEAHKEYDERLREANERAETLGDVMDNLFNEHFLTNLNSVARLGMSITMKEQHSYASAQQAALKQYHTESIESVKRAFDRLVERGVIPPSNTKTAALLYMFCVISANDLHIHETLDTESPVDRAELYSGLRKMLTEALIQGFLE